MWVRPRYWPISFADARPDGGKQKASSPLASHGAIVRPIQVKKLEGLKPLVSIVFAIAPLDKLNLQAEFENARGHEFDSHRALRCVSGFDCQAAPVALS